MNTDELINTLNWRYATKAFTDQAVSEEKISALAESLRLSPSSFGLQPWKFIVIQNKEIQESLVPHSWNQGQVSQASALFVLCRPSKIDESDVDAFIQLTADIREMNAEDLAPYSGMIKSFMSQMTEEQKIAWMEKQIYIALANLLTSAALLEVDACPMEGFIPEKYSEILGLGEKNLIPVVVCPVGYRCPDDKYATLAKVRYSAEQVIEYIK